MNKHERANRQYMYQSLMSLGLSFDECETLRRCSMTLHRWAERECGDGSNWSIERDETTGKPYNVNHMTGTRYRIADKESGAIRRATLLLKSKGLTFYHQGDPRGASVYVLRPSDIADGQDIHSVYSRGIAVY